MKQVNAKNFEINHQELGVKRHFHISLAPLISFIGWSHVCKSQLLLHDFRFYDSLFHLLTALRMKLVSNHWLYQ